MIFSETLSLYRRMILLRVFKNKNGQLHHMTYFLTVEGYSRWAKTTKHFNLISLLPVGVLTLAILKNGFFTDLNILEIDRTPGQIHLPPYTLSSHQTSQSELFFLAHKDDKIPTYNSGQINRIFKCIIETRDYLKKYVLGDMHPYTDTMLDLRYNESITGLENGFEFSDFKGSTIANFITAYMKDLGAKIKNFGLIQQIAETNIPMSRVCHVFQSNWKPKPDIAKQFVLNEMGFNLINQKYTDQIITSVVECVGSVDLSIQNPDIGFLGMRLNGFDVIRPETQPISPDAPAYICKPKPLYVDYDSGSDFTDSLSDPGQNLHMSVNKSKTKLNQKFDQLSKSDIKGPNPLQNRQFSAKVAKTTENINTFHKTRTHSNTRANNSTEEFSNQPAKKTNQNLTDASAKKSIATTGYDGSKAGPSRANEDPAKISDTQNSNLTEFAMFPVLIGPGGDRWIYTQGQKFTKTNLPPGLRNDMITDDGISTVFVNREGVVSVNGRNLGYLGQDRFSQIGEIVTSYDTDNFNPEMLPPTPSPPQNVSHKLAGQNSPSPRPSQSQSLESYPVRPKILPKTKTLKSSNPAKTITDQGCQTDKSLKNPIWEWEFAFKNQPVENHMKDLTDKQSELGAHFNEMLQQFQTDIINKPATIKPNRNQLMGIIKQADDLAESISTSSATVKEIRGFIIEMVMDLLQTHFGTSMSETEEEIDRLKRIDHPTLIHRMINGFTKKNLDHIWNITPRPLFYTSNQDQKSLEIQTIYAKYTPTIETCRQTIRDTLVEAQKEAFDVLNRPPTQPTQNLPPTQPSLPDSILVPETQQTGNSPPTSDIDIIPDTQPEGAISDIQIGTKRHVISHRSSGKRSKTDKHIQ